MEDVDVVGDIASRRRRAHAGDDSARQLCPCIHWAAKYTVVHLPTCPVANLLREPVWVRPWLDLETYLQDPRQFHTQRHTVATRIPPIGIPCVDVWTRVDVTQADHAAAARAKRDALLEGGKRRLDRFVDIINYARQEISDCNLVYPVVDEILHYYFAQLHALIAGEACYTVHAAALHAYTRTTPKKQQSFMICGRQAGKTSAGGLLLAALLCCADGGDLCRLYASKQDQAALILDATRTIYNKLPDHLRNPRIWKDNHHGFSVISEYDGIEAVITANCSNVKGVRGHAPKLIFLDEFMLIEKDFMENHINAILGKDNRPLIAVSTPGEPGCYMLNLCLDIRDNPEQYPFCHLLNYSMVCDRHRAAGTPLLCRDNLHYLPPWRSSAKVRDTIKRYGEAGAENCLKEIFGEPMQGGERLFNVQMLKDTFKRARVPAHRIEPAGRTIYISFDPAKGGGCELGIMTCCWGIDGVFYILGLEGFLTNRNANMQDITTIVLEHVAKLRALFPRWSVASTLVPFSEDNGNKVISNSLAGLILDRPECAPAQSYVGYKLDCSRNSRGVQTTHDVKEDMVVQLQELMVDGRIQICEDVFTTGRRSCKQAELRSTADTLLGVLCQQLINFHYDDKNHITGIVADGDKDDIAMAFLLAIYWSRDVRRRYPQLLGWR
jgi:hypothetical protein